MNAQRVAIGIGIVCLLGGWGAGIYGVTHLLRGGGFPSFGSPPAPPVVRTPAPKIVPLPKDLESFLRKTRALAPADVARLRARVLKNPGDAPARALLLDFSMFAPHDEKLKRLHDEQAVWFVANLPATPLLGGGSMMVQSYDDANTYALIRRLFEEALPKLPQSADLRANFAAFILGDDHEGAIRLLEDAARLDPKSPDRYADLAFAQFLASRGTFGRIDREQANLTLANYAKAQSLGGSPEIRYYLEAALDADRLDVARRVATRALKDRDTEDDFYAAHTTLGLLALREGDVPSAKVHLLDSAKVEGSPVLGSFGPDPALAKALLEQGERATVLAFVKATGRFWEDERQVRWRKALEAGNTPDWE